MSDSHHPADDRPAGIAPAVTDLFLPSEAATEACGAALARALQDATGLVVWLTGDLGAGKTTFTRGLLRALGHEGNVKSPTYTLLELYSVSRISVYHFDFYRLNHPDEFLDAGLEEYFSADAICLVEWADKALPHVPAPDLEVSLAVEGTGRRVRLYARTARGHACLSRSSLASQNSAH